MSLFDIKIYNYKFKMKQNKSISVPQKGMNKDGNISSLNPQEYRLGVNINSESTSDTEQIISNEPSNYYGVKFPETYKVINATRTEDRTYYFLTSTTTDINSADFKRSSIGYVDNTIIDTFSQDNPNINCTDCNNQQNTLDTPLENIVQTPSHAYIELVDDRCINISDIEEKGLNFNINFPIKKVDIKQEKLGTVLYWEDNRNSSRYLQVSRIEEALENNTFDYLHTLDIPCHDPLEAPCLDIDKFSIFPKHRRMRIEAEKQQIGGNLKKGTYEFWGAYCDAYGNTATEYCTPTNPISIWDENNNILEQTELDEFTNFAIKLKIHNLDIEHFKYYKISVVERNNVLNTQSVFLAGVYPTTDDVVVYTHSGSSNDDLYITRGNVSLKKRMDFNELVAIKPTFEKAKISMVSDERRFIGGLTAKEEINLQPVINLFSGLVKAQTSVANENLYKSSVATSKYKYYTRNEVQPLAIRFLYKDGGYSANFHFIGRPKNSFDSTVVLNSNKNKASLINNQTTCSEDNRNERWQIFNTASPIDTEDCFDLEANSIKLPPENIKKTCSVDIATFIPSDNITLNIEDTFYDLETYINTHLNNICNISSIYSNPLICSYLSDTYTETCTPPYVGDCTTPVLLSSKNIIKEVIGEVKSFNYKTDTEYLRTVPPKFCNQFKRNTSDGNYTQDTPFMDLYSPCTLSLTFPISFVRRPVFFREGDFQNENCSYAQDITLQTNITQSYSSVVLNYQASDTIANLVTDNSLFASTASFGFHTSLHNKAQFFRAEKNGKDKIVLEITKKNGCQGTGDLYELFNNTIIRYSIYNNCTDKTLLYTNLVDLNNGELVTLDISAYPNNFIIAIDTKIVPLTIDCPPDSTVEVFHLAPPCACFGIYVREQEKKSVNVSWDKITLKKELEYQAICNFTLPKVNECEPIPYKKYNMAYWESVLEYSDNKELYDSSTIKIRPEDLNNLASLDKNSFIDYYTDGLNIGGTYNLKNADFRCQPIRHPKLPDNTVAPFIIDNISHKNNADSIIFPIGINFDSKIVETLLEVAYNNNLITKKQKNNIYGWEILRGDNTIHKSNIMNGILYDVYNYTKSNQIVNFSNFPFNDLGQNKFLINPIDGNLINHPFDGVKNNKFTFLSPDAFLTNPQIPTELSLQGYLMGSANIGFSNVKKHPQWTILGSDAYILAETLAIAELALELAIKIADYTTQSGLGHSWFVVGVGSTGSNIAGSISSGVALGVFIASSAIQAVIKYGEYRYKWLEIFTNLGKLENFASFQHGVGKHNKLLKIDNLDDNYLRKLSVKKYLTDDYLALLDETNGTTIKVNNKSREKSIFVSLGNSYLEYPSEYYNYDNNVVNSNSSNFLASEVGCIDDNHQRDIANPYVALRNYIPDQWDTIDSIKWLTTNYIFNLEEDTSCKVIYGGTSVISRFSYRIKVPFFNDNAINIADKLPYKYSKNSNIGQTKYFCDYETSDDSTFNYLGILFPEKSSSYNFDCITGRNDFYIKSPTKFYLYSHGVIDFLVESEINCNFRYGKKQPKDQFYNGQNLGEFLQEVNLPISEPNTFYYNNTYNFPVSNTQYKKLDRLYSKELWNKRRFYKNAWIWSEKDNNENALVDPYLIYKPNNFWEDKSNKGDLIDLRSIESNQFFARFEDKLQLYNQVNQYADSINAKNKELGTGFLYGRPIEFKSTDLGFAGTQNTDFVSCPYGHFSVDDKRGKIFKFDQNGGNMEIISESIQGKPSGMKNWFREHLPFKILKYLPEVDVDNKFKGIGLNMWWDARFDRVFITKRDYILQSGINKNLFRFDKETKQLFYNDVEVFFDTEVELTPNNKVKLFKDVSFTISYKPSEGSWNSFFTFYPDYSVSHNDYFQVGYNWGKHKETLWNNLLNNSSFGVFQGELHGWILEFPISNEGVNKILASLSMNVEARRFQSNYDYVVAPEVGVTELFVYNSKQNSGSLILIPQQTLADDRKYPKIVGNKQEILTTFTEGKQFVNTFFNRVINEKSNVPHLIRDENNIFSTINDRAVKFGGQRVLSRLKGSDFIVNVSNTQNSQFQILIKNIINQEIIEE